MCMEHSFRFGQVPVRRLSVPFQWPVTSRGHFTPSFTLLHWHSCHSAKHAYKTNTLLFPLHSVKPLFVYLQITVEAVKQVLLESTVQALTNTQQRNKGYTVTVLLDNDGQVIGTNNTKCFLYLLMIILTTIEWKQFAFISRLQLIFYFIKYFNIYIFVSLKHWIHIQFWTFCFEY